MLKKNRKKKISTEETGQFILTNNLFSCGYLKGKVEDQGSGGGMMPGNLGRSGMTSYTSGPGPGQNSPIGPSHLYSQGRFSLSNSCQEFQVCLASSAVKGEGRERTCRQMLTPPACRSSYLAILQGEETEQQGQPHQGAGHHPHNLSWTLQSVETYSTTLQWEICTGTGVTARVFATVILWTSGA